MTTNYDTGDQSKGLRRPDFKYGYTPVRTIVLLDVVTLKYEL